MLAVAAQFLYVGAQVGAWSYFINYVEQATGVGDKAAGYMLTGTLAAFAVGRFSSAWLMKHFARRELCWVRLLGCECRCWRLVAITQVNWLGAGCLLTTSLFMSIMFPTIFALGLKGMGDKDEDGGVAAGDGDSGRGRADEGDGGAGRHEGTAGGLPGAGGLFCGCGAVCVVLVESIKQRKLGG